MVQNAIRIVVWVIFLIGGSVLGILLDLHWCRSLVRNPFFHIMSALVGFVLLQLVMRVSRTTGRLLARYGREGELPRMQTNRLVTRGVYGCMRHPMHLGLLFFPLSVALMVGSPTFILFIWPIEVFLMLVMIKWVEEREALAKFGNAYREYQKRVPFFNFKTECLRKLFVRI